MSALGTIQINLSEIPKELIYNGKKGNYITLQVGLNDETNKFGHNINVTIPQSQEQRQAKEPKKYIGNGKVFWTDGKLTVADKVEEPVGAAQQSPDRDDLPF